MLRFRSFRLFCTGASDGPRSLLGCTLAAMRRAPGKASCDRMRIATCVPRAAGLMPECPESKVAIDSLRPLDRTGWRSRRSRLEHLSIPPIALQWRSKSTVSDGHSLPQQTSVWNEVLPRHAAARDRSHAVSVRMYRNLVMEGWSAVFRPSYPSTTNRFKGRRACSGWGRPKGASTDASARRYLLPVVTRTLGDPARATVGNPLRSCHSNASAVHGAGSAHWHSWASGCPVDDIGAS